MGIIIQLLIGLLSFTIGLGAVGGILHAKGLLIPVFQFLKDQQRLEDDVFLLEQRIKDKEKEIKRLKTRLQQLKMEQQYGEDSNTVLGRIVEDERSRSIDQLQDKTSSSNDRFRQSPDEEDIASLGDMNKRLKQISVLVESLPKKLSDVLCLAVNSRDEKLNQLFESVDAITKLSTLEQTYIDSVLNNASSKSEELEIKSAIIKMKSARANMFQAINFLKENRNASLTGNVVIDFKQLLNLV